MKRLKYFHEIQIMRNGMEQVKSGNGTVAVEPAWADAGADMTVKVTYTVGEDTIYIGGVLRTTIELPTGQELLITGANPVSKYPAGCRVFVFWDPAVAAVVERGKAE